MAMTGAKPAFLARVGKTRAILLAGVVVLLAGMALDTRIVEIGSADDFRQQAFNPDRFGQNEFPRIRDAVIERAPDAATLATALAGDKDAAIARYGTMAGAFPVLPVTLTGTVGEGQSGTFAVTVDALPDGTSIRIQTGPAINGTELRDITGDIPFGAFKNQIEYQNAGAGLNRAMAAKVLADLDRDTLTGRTISVTGAFTLINPKSWLVTPVALEIE